MKRKQTVLTQSIFCKKHIWKILFLLCFFLPGKKVSAQIIPLAEGIKDSIFLTYTHNDSVYVAHFTTINPNWWNRYDSVTISYWNGKSWKHFPPIYNYHYGYFSSLAVYKNEIYVCGKFDTLTDLKNTKGIIKFNGNKWIQAAQDSVAFTHGTSLLTTENRLFATHQPRA